MPERYGRWQRAHQRFTLWRRDGTWDRVLARPQLRADKEGLLDYARWNIDSTSICAGKPLAGAKKGLDMDEPEDHALGLSRGGGTKVHLATEKRGLLGVCAHSRRTSRSTGLPAPDGGGRRSATSIGFTRSAGRRQDVCLRERSRLAAIAAYPGIDSAPKQSGCAGAVDRCGANRLSRPERSGTMRGQAQGVQATCDPLQKASLELWCHGHPGDDHDLYLKAL
jgi:hypothetical protein